MGSSPLISTLWFDRAILSVKSTVCFWSSAEVTASFCCGAKPSASTLTEYGPGFSCGKLNRPESSVFALRFSPVSLFVTLTVACGAAAPLADDGARAFTLGKGQFRQEEMKRQDKSEYRKCRTQSGSRPGSAYP